MSDRMGKGRIIAMEREATNLFNSRHGHSARLLIREMWSEIKALRTENEQLKAQLADAMAVIDKLGITDGLVRIHLNSDQGLGNLELYCIQEAVIHWRYLSGSYSTFQFASEAFTAQAAQQQEQSDEQG